MRDGWFDHDSLSFPLRHIPVFLMGLSKNLRSDRVNFLLLFICIYKFSPTV